MACAELRFLQHELECGIGETGRHGTAAVPVNEDCTARLQWPGPVEHVSEQGFAAQRVEHLWQTGMHACALAGSEDYDVEGGVFHWGNGKRSELSHNAPEKRGRP